MKKLSHILPPHPARNTTQPAYPILISLPSYFSPPLPAFSLPLLPPPPPPHVCLHNNNGATNAFFGGGRETKKRTFVKEWTMQQSGFFFREGRGETNQDPPGAIIIF